MSNFKGSELEKSIITNNDIKGLKNVKSYTEGAIEFHTLHNKENEIIFFKSALKLINSKIKKLDKIKI